MNRPVIIFLLISLLMISSCTDNKKGNTIISGRIPDASGALLKLQELGPDNSKTIDSVTMDAEGKFSFKVLSDETGLYLLGISKLTPLVLEVSPGNSVRISGSVINFPADVIISGSDNSLDLLGFLNASAVNRKKFDSLENILISRQDDPGFAELTRELDESLKPVWDSQRTLEIKYIDEHPNSLTSLLVLNHGLSVSPLLTFKDDSVYFLRLDSSLNKAFPGNKHAGFHHKRIIQEREVETLKKRSK